ncbi:MAG TPA: hypothetical protein VFX44_04840 [Solirubrobacterales bacterium]|nr:hypothetical protein [Solirubrobacterales bacterium]
MFKKIAISVLFALLALAVPAAASAASGGAIVFSRMTDRLPLGADGEPVPEPPVGGLFAFKHGDTIQLTEDPADREPSFSADGRKIAFVRKGDIWVMRADGSGQLQLTSGSAIDSRPLVSPNGRYVLFQRRELSRSGRDLYTVDIRGGAERLLTGTPADEHYAAFSPDGRQIVYVRKSKGGRGDIWSIRPSGIDVHRLTRTPRINDFSPHYLGKTIVFSRGSNWGRKDPAGIYAMDRRGRHVRKLIARAPSIRLEDVNARTRTILFCRPRGLWVKQFGGQSRRIVNFSKGESTAGVFSPNGRRIAALNGELWGQSLWVLNAANGRRLATVTSASNMEGGESNGTIGRVVAWQPVS